MKKNLILEFCSKSVNVELSKPVYFYDEKESLNFIEIDGMPVPYIDSTKEMLELITKTNVLRESDDNSIQYELSTKTEAGRESDDYQICNGGLELDTKTFVNREADQMDFSNSLIDTVTKIAREDSDHINEFLN